MLARCLAAGCNTRASIFGQSALLMAIGIIQFRSFPLVLAHWSNCTTQICMRLHFSMDVRNGGSFLRTVLDVSQPAHDAWYPHHQAEPLYSCLLSQFALVRCCLKLHVSSWQTVHFRCNHESWYTSQCSQWGSREPFKIIAQECSG